MTPSDLFMRLDLLHAARAEKTRDAALTLAQPCYIKEGIGLVCKMESLSGFGRACQAYVGPKPETPCGEYRLPQLSILLLPFFLGSDSFFVFFAFLVCDICPPLPLLDSLRQVMVVQNAR